MNVTLVAFHGTKPAPLTALIADVQRILCDRLGAGFDAYPPRQVHATIVGLEGRRIGDRLVNANYLTIERREVSMDLARAMEIAEAALPLDCRLAGFRRRRRYPFTSRGRHPYVRSFSLRGADAVVMGWPCDAGDYPPRLAELRRRFERAGVLHKYHHPGGEPDNDLFFVLGKLVVDPRASHERERVEALVRERLALLEPLHLTIGRDQLQLVAYRDPRLPVETSRVLPLPSTDDGIREVEELYPFDTDDG